MSTIATFFLYSFSILLIGLTIIERFDLIEKLLSKHQKLCNQINLIPSFLISIPLATQGLMAIIVFYQVELFDLIIPFCLFLGSIVIVFNAFKDAALYATENQTLKERY